MDGILVLGQLDTCIHMCAWPNEWANSSFAEIGEKIPSDLPANQIRNSRQNSGDKDDETSLSFKDEVISKDLTMKIVHNKPAGYVSRQTDQPYDWWQESAKVMWIMNYAVLILLVHGGT